MPTPMFVDDQPPELDSREFRRVLSHYPTGVCVITTASGGMPAGMAVGTFTSISLNPPLVGFLPRTGSATLAQIMEAGAFCVNVLGADGERLCQRFSCAEPHERFTGVPWRPGRGGLPALTDAVAWVDCAVEDTVEIGDHTLVIGRVMHLDNADQRLDALVFHRGQYFSCAAS